MSQSALCISNTWTASALPRCRVTSGDAFKFISRRRSSSCRWEICSFVISQVTDSEGSSKWFMPTRGKNLSRSKRTRIHSLKEELIMRKHLHELSVFPVFKKPSYWPEMQILKRKLEHRFHFYVWCFSCFSSFNSYIESASNLTLNLEGHRRTL